jgi:hypothetical protein
MTPCRLVHRYQRLGRQYCFPLQGSPGVDTFSCHINNFVPLFSHSLTLQIKMIHSTNTSQYIYLWLYFWHLAHWNNRTKHYDPCSAFNWSCLYSVQHTLHILYNWAILLHFPKICNFCGAQNEAQLPSSGKATSQKCYPILPIYDATETSGRTATHYWNHKKFQAAKNFTYPSNRPGVKSGRHSRLCYKGSLTLGFCFI